LVILFAQVAAFLRNISGLIRRNAEAGNRLPHSSSEISANSVSFGATFQGKAESQPSVSLAKRWFQETSWQISQPATQPWK